MAAKSSLNSLQTFNQTPLHFASGRPSQRGFRIAQLLLERWSEGRFAEDDQKCLPVHYAVQCGNIATMKLLLKEEELKQVTHVISFPDFS